MTEEIKPNGVYTTEEVEKLLKVSNSTVKRLLKSGILRAAKVGKQYRIMGWEILKLISPVVEEKAAGAYLNIKKKTIKVIKDW